MEAEKSGIASAKYINVEKQTIKVEINGETLYVPNDPENRHRQMIAAWEAKGGVIEVFQ
jgi:hypothetical protein